MRALEALGEPTQVFHTNEGHAGFLGLERIRRLIKDDGLTFTEAIEAVRSGTIFTTHTPVPAGIDQFARPLMERYFKAWADECSVPFDELMALGHFPDAEKDAPFNMAVMGMRLAGMSNAVAKLHGDTSRRMFQSLWPDVPVDEVPITSVTNGVQPRTWTSPEMNEPAGALRAAGVARGRARGAGPASTTSATTSCGGRASRTATAWSPSSASG